MANETELEKIDRAAEYFERYFEFEDAVTVSKENKEYLKTYIPVSYTHLTLPTN